MTNEELAGLVAEEINRDHLICALILIRDEQERRGVAHERQ